VGRKPIAIEASAEVAAVPAASAVRHGHLWRHAAAAVAPRGATRNVGEDAVAVADHDAVRVAEHLGPMLFFSSFLFAKKSAKKLVCLTQWKAKLSKNWIITLFFVNSA
jgi:hypothetical protein